MEIFGVKYCRWGAGSVGEMRGRRGGPRCPYTTASRGQDLAISGSREGDGREGGLGQVHLGVGMRNVGGGGALFYVKEIPRGERGGTVALFVIGTQGEEVKYYKLEMVKSEEASRCKENWNKRKDVKETNNAIC